MKRIIQILTHRATTVAFAIFVQLTILIYVIIRFNRFFSSFYGAMLILSGIVVVLIINNKSNPAYKLAWIIPILVLPIFGVIFYLIFGHNGLSKNEQLKMQTIEQKSTENLEKQPEVLNHIKAHSERAYVQSKYISDYAYSPPHTCTDATYYPTGESFFEALIDALGRAEQYIFMEYFIIQEGHMWDRILSILVEKVASGVEVRLIYDDIGCILTLPRRYAESLEALGIKTAVFNKFSPHMSSKHNNRDHRKITVIDGLVGFTGGINLADEYINRYEKHGHWKDSAIKLEGDAVWSFTVMFLSLWNYIRHVDEEYAPYRPIFGDFYPEIEKGIVQPFTDNPLDNEPVGASIYMNLITRAQDTLYIKSPYLIIDNEMITALCLSAKSGVDVRIITPSVPDKWYVHATTRSYYKQLIEAGIKIYEYSPGFIHEKVIVSDGQFGVIGTVNLDYRSLYLHFECGVWLYHAPCIQSMQDDFLSILPMCKAITLEACMKTPFFVRIGRALLRFFAPLM